MWASVLDAVILCVTLWDAMSIGVGVRRRIGGLHCKLQCKCRRQLGRLVWVWHSWNALLKIW